MHIFANISSEITTLCVAEILAQVLSGNFLSDNKFLSLFVRSERSEQLCYATNTRTLSAAHIGIRTKPQ